VAICSNCNSSILFGGSTDAVSALRFCNEECHAQYNLNVYSNEIPDSIVEEYALSLRNGDCPYCGSTGPLECYIFKQVFALIIYSNWSTIEYLSCKKCASAKQRDVQIICLLLGWWSLYGLFGTPSCLISNANAIRKKQDDLPSEELLLFSRGVLSSLDMEDMESLRRYLSNEKIENA
jgi:hypothetical protein